MKSFDTVVKRRFFKFLMITKLMVVFILLNSVHASADGFGHEQAVVTGKVTDENGAALAGVSVQIKGTNKGAATNSTGVFSINASDNDVLVFSYVGYETQQVAVAGKTEVNVTLAPAKSTSLEQVVVIGYGTAQKRDLTGSIAKVDGKEVADKPNPNPVSSLQGKVAGLYVVNSGTPGQQPDIRIRGTTSIGQVAPLYVVDGIFEDNIDYLNPNDIESIEILKDPSSLAIFGVKGATGVIAITTKKAKAGQVVINFSSNFGFKKLVDKIGLADSATFNKLFNEENANNSIATPDYSALTANTDWIDAVTRTGKFTNNTISVSGSTEKNRFNEENANNGIATPDYSALTANTDWIDAVTRTGKFTNNTISVSGSTEKNRFNLSASYLYDEGIIKHEQLQRWTVSLSDEFKISKAIKVGAIVNASRQENPYDATWVLDAARQVMPQVSSGTKPFIVQDPYSGDSVTMNLYSGLDVALQNSGVINPLLVLENEWDKTINVGYRTVGNIYAEINFLRYFTFRSTLYADISTLDNRKYTPLYYGYDPLSNTPVSVHQTTQVSQNNNTNKTFQQDHVLTFKKAFGDHNLTATAGFTTYYFGYFNRTGIAKQYTTGTAQPIPDDPRFWYITSGVENPSNTFATSSQGEKSTVSYLARALYNFQGKYYLNASFRDDGSSQIPNQNRHQQFWAVGAAWELTKEGFMKDQKIFNFLKLKGSYGVLGNQSTYGLASFYPFYPNLQSGSSTVFGTTIYNAARPAYKVNPDLKWETVDGGEVGIELNAFDNRLHFEGNYYNKTTKNLMTYIELSSLGQDNELTNGGSLKNWGEEFTASWNQKFTKDLTLNLSGNLTFLKNKVQTLSPDLPGGVIIQGFENNGSAEARTLPGQPIGSFFGYVVEGIYQSYADILKSPNASALGSYRPGDFKFKDVNGDGKITADDRTVIGNPTPDFTYGASINLTYKGFNLAIDMVGVYGNEIFRTWGSLEAPFQRVNYAAFQTSAWNGPGTSNWVPLVSQADRFNYNGSTYNIEDGSYFRIRNVQLGYSFSKSTISQLHLTSLRLFANVQNLKTWKHNQGYTSEYGGSATAFGFDFAGGAIPMVATFGLNLSF